MPIAAAPAPPSPAGITGNDWIEATRAYLLTFHQEQMAVLGAPAAANASSLTFTSPPQVAVGHILEVDSEVYRVLAPPNGTQVSVQPGVTGSVSTTHATNTPARINPRFPTFAILRALNDSLRDMSGSNYYAMKTAVLNYDSSIYAYDLGDPNILEVYDIRFKTFGPTKIHPRIADYELVRDSDTTEFPSGVALQIFEAAWQTGLPMRVQYKATFTLITDQTLDVSLTGVPSTGLDLPPIAAALRMMAGREIQRNFTESQPDTRRASEVPAGAVAGSIRGLQALWMQRWGSEVASLATTYPTLGKIYGRRSAWGVR